MSFKVRGEIDCEELWDAVRNWVLVPRFRQSNIRVCANLCLSYQLLGICSRPNPFMSSVPLELFWKLKKLESTFPLSVPAGISGV